MRTLWILPQRGKRQLSALVLTIFIAIAGARLPAHACEGVETWRFN
ncbi:MAG TPA: hypothetical protein VMG40_17425 [Bryobacteraceae bacterium]|nr:hypothetical protein [Bryobacteraceae bacterium]